MVNYIEKITHEFEGVHEYTHPADEKLFISDAGGLPCSDPTGFHRTVAKLLFLCKCGRPDIALPVHFLITRVKNPTELDEKKLSRVVGFMKGTLKNIRRISSEPFDQLQAYIDAAHAAHVGESLWLEGLRSSVSPESQNVLLVIALMLKW